MFTGIVETLGTVSSIQKNGENTHFKVTSEISQYLKVDQSVSHNGVCLTVTQVDDNSHWVTAVHETLIRSTLGLWQEGSQTNLERCMPADGRFDGHFVQGHVDGMGHVEHIEEGDGSWEFVFETGGTDHLLVEKGSITINGISLTCFDIQDSTFRVAIIPYTFDHTNFHELKQGDPVNLEFDIIGKYIERIMSQRKL